MTQNQIVLNWLKGKGNKLTSLDAYQRWGVQRLGARVWDLRRQGYKIKAEIVAVSNRFGDKCRVAQYSLTK